MSNAHRLDHSRFAVLPGTEVRLKDHDPAYTGGFADKREAKAAMLEDVSALANAQELLWASREYSLIVLLQAMDAAGKDGIIKHVMSGLNPQGVEVHSFKAPTEEERLHHFLWRPARALPARGRIAIFNRSYYEEVLVVRVHPELLEQESVRRELRRADPDEFWKSRYEDINAFERTLVRDNVRVIKFFLHVSKEEQRKRFLKRLRDPEKQWKFSAADLREREFWDEYVRAYEDMLGATSTPWAPWFVIPADKKWFARACVADIIAARIEALGLRYPQLGEEKLAELKRVRHQLESEGND